MGVTGAVACPGPGAVPLVVGDDGIEPPTYSV